jgi:hypothetical protein
MHGWEWERKEFLKKHIVDINRKKTSSRYRGNKCPPENCINSLKAISFMVKFLGVSNKFSQ